MAKQKVKRLTPGTAGFTLIELLMVVLIIAVAAAIALPTGTNSDTTQIEAAAAEVAAATRFARDESRRTGAPHGIRQQNAQNRLRIFRIDGTGTLIYDLHHPVTRQLWDIQFDNAPGFPGVSITRTMVWRGTCNADGNIAFRADGTPHCTDPLTTLLDRSTLTLSRGSTSRNVVIDGFTGQVSIQ